MPLLSTKRLVFNLNVHSDIIQLPQYVNKWFKIATLPAVIFFRAIRQVSGFCVTSFTSVADTQIKKVHKYIDKYTESSNH